MKPQKLELTWIGKDEQPKLEARGYFACLSADTGQTGRVTG